MNRKWLSVITLSIFLGSIVSACVRGTGFGPDVYVSPAGSDSNDCWSAATPCATIDRALSRLSDLGEIHLAAGEYRLAGSISDLHGLTGITFRGAGSSSTTLYSPSGGGEVLRLSTPVLVEFYDLAFDGRYTPAETSLGSTGVLMGPGGIVRIQDCLFNGLRYGIANNGGFLYVHRSQFTGSTIGILNRNDRSAFTTVDGSQFSANSYAIRHLRGRMKIAGSTFAGNGLPILGGPDTVTVQNEDRMSISDSTFQEDAYSAVTNVKDTDLNLTNVYVSGGEGIGIENYGQLTADYLTITGKPGGGFFNGIDASALTESNARLSHARIDGNGSFGIQNQQRLVLSDGIVQGNEGDGIVNTNDHVSILHSAIVGNHGVGIYARASTYIEDSTISGNDQEGINFIGAGDFYLSLHFATVADNAGGGIWSLAPPGTSVVVYNSIIALNPGGLGNCTGQAEWYFDGFNLACDVPDSITELGLGPLASLGGTWVHPLLAGSPALDSAIVRPVWPCPSRDQTGTARPQPAGWRCDIGAFERTGATPSSLEITPVPTSASLPTFTFTQQANCRLGPNTLYASVGFGQIGQQARIEGLSDPAGWYYVLLPDAVNRCFVAGSTGEVSGPTDGLSVHPAPPLPVAPAAPVLNVSNQTCDATKYVVRLSWKDVDGEDGYRVYRDGTLIATLGANATSYDDTSPDYNSHEYLVEAHNAVGATASAKMKSPGCVY